VTTTAQLLRHQHQLGSAVAAPGATGTVTPFVQTTALPMPGAETIPEAYSPAFAAQPAVSTAAIPAPGAETLGDYYSPTATSPAHPLEAAPVSPRVTGAVTPYVETTALPMPGAETMPLEYGAEYAARPVVQTLNLPLPGGETLPIRYSPTYVARPAVEAAAVPMPGAETLLDYYSPTAVSRARTLGTREAVSGARGAVAPYVLPLPTTYPGEIESGVAAPTGYPLTARAPVEGVQGQVQPYVSTLPSTYPGELEPAVSVATPSGHVLTPRASAEGVQGQVRPYISALPTTYPGELEPTVNLVAPTGHTLAARTPAEGVRGQVQPYVASTLAAQRGGFAETGVDVMPSPYDEPYPGELEPPVTIPVRRAWTPPLPGEAVVLAGPGVTPVNPPVAAREAQPLVQGIFDSISRLAESVGVPGVATFLSDIISGLPEPGTVTAQRAGEVTFPPPPSPPKTTAPPPSPPPSTTAPRLPAPSETQPQQVAEKGKVGTAARAAGTLGEQVPRTPLPRAQAGPPAETGAEPTLAGIMSKDPELGWTDEDWRTITRELVGREMGAAEGTAWLRRFAAEHNGQMPWQVGPGDSVNNLIDHLLALGESLSVAEAGGPGSVQFEYGNRYADAGVVPSFWERAHAARYAAPMLTPSGALMRRPGGDVYWRGLIPGEMRPTWAPYFVAAQRMGEIPPEEYFWRMARPYVPYRPAMNPAAWPRPPAFAYPPRVVSL